MGQEQGLVHWQGGDRAEPAAARYRGSAVSMQASEPCNLSFKTEIVCLGK